MKISNVVINNFRCYYRENRIDFNTNGKITLIYGDSGYGKSSFLQFFRWMFYNDPDFGKDDDQPLYNTEFYDELKEKDFIEVKGLINFEHADVKYSLERSVKFEVSKKEYNLIPSDNDYFLQSLEGNNWVKYGGDISEKINSIMPKELSKYFLLAGEKARDIVLNSTDLRAAINALFGIDAYELAIEHLGSSYKKKSVIGYYSNLMTSQIKSVPGLSVAMSPAEFQETLEDLSTEIDNITMSRKNLLSNIKNMHSRRDEILKILGEASNKKNLEEIIQRDEKDIKEKEKEIAAQLPLIGNLFYKRYPYLILTETTSKSAKLLREKQESFKLDYRSMFNSLKKELLNEIIEKGSCVCGRKLDEDSIKYIKDTMIIMPPDSYAYQFGQYIKKSKQETSVAGMEVYKYEDIINSIALIQNNIAELEGDKKSKENDLKKLSQAQELVDELENIDKEMIKCNRTLKEFDGDIAKKNQMFKIAEQQLDKLIKADSISSKYTKVINFFKEVHDDLDIEKKEKERKVALELNKCVRDVFKKLTTQKDLNADKIDFVDKNFTLRTTYLTGGQLAIDEYSYVIGIIKALQKLGMGNNENPIIVDAPFAFTGNEQSEHIFTTLPKIVKQTVLLTLDLNKVKNVLLNNEELYDFYVIDNVSQRKAIIRKGDIHDIKF